MRRNLVASTMLALAIGATALTAADGAHAQTQHQANGAHSKIAAYSVTAKVNKTELLVDNKVKIKATVQPASAGSPVKLQLKYDDQKKWKTIDTGTLNNRGKVTFKDKISSVRTRKYRVLKPGDARIGTGHGDTEKVVVFGWRDLISLKAATASSFGSTSSASMNGVAYPNSLRTFTFTSPANASIEFNLNRDCKAFRGTAGLEDGSTSNGTGSVTMATDGTQRYTGAFTLAQSAPVAFDVTKVFRLSITATAADGGIAAVGTPQVLCSF